MLVSFVALPEIKKPEFKTKKAAWAYVGGLGKPSKMPGKTYGLSAFDCNVGSKLNKVKGSTCEGCYARKGQYVFKNVKQAHKNRLASIYKSGWVNAMVKLIEGEKLFRWHDSGDIQSMKHLKNIVAVAQRTPNVNHWLPTREKGIIKSFLKDNTFPSNMCVRLSTAMIDSKPLSIEGVNTSSVHENEPAQGHECPASKHENECEKAGCYACWDKSVINVSYPKH